jgi:hypothetical protein
MKSTIPTPKFEISKQMASTLEIDMWNITGKYADGAWHQLIHACVKDWVATNKFKGKATLWSSVIPSSNFNGYGNSCFLAQFGMVGILELLEAKLRSSFPKQVRLSDEVQVIQGTWRPYLHLGHGKIWEISDATAWVQLD